MSNKIQKALNLSDQDIQDQDNENDLLGPEYQRPSRLYQIDKNAKSATWTEEGNRGQWYASSAKHHPTYARSYKATINPKDYLRLTLGKDYDKVINNPKDYDFNDLDEEKFYKESTPIWLLLSFYDKKNPNRAKVIGHEGRHRAYGLMKQGIDKMDVNLDVGDKGAYGSHYDKYNPFDLKSITLEDEGKNLTTIANPIAMNVRNWKIPDKGDLMLTTSAINDIIEDEKNFDRNISKGISDRDLYVMAEYIWDPETELDEITKANYLKSIYNQMKDKTYRNKILEIAGRKK